jgi:hypothetical protein
VEYLFKGRQNLKKYHAFMPKIGPVIDLWALSERSLYKVYRVYTEYKEYIAYTDRAGKHRPFFIASVLLAMLSPSL